MPPRVSRPRLAYDLWRQYGTYNFTYRVWHIAWRRAGLLRSRFPTPAWTERPLGYWTREGVPAEPVAYRAWRGDHRPAYFFDPGALPALPEQWTASPRAEADEIASGKVRYFSRTVGDLGFPFDWFLNPFTGKRVDAARHWCDRNDFEADQGDIKFYWEPARFAWVYPLVRAYAADRDKRRAETFWALFESWRAANPPNMGPSWQCGQECALRVMALTFAWHGFWNALASTPARIADLAATLATLAERIESNIRFAQVQMGNHALSEAVGLYTVGTLFPEFRRAEAWRRHGRQVIELEAKLHSYSDGSYIQHSFNYHRLMLHDFLWALRLGELNGDRIDPYVTEICGKHARFLYDFQEPTNGHVPTYGQNDGAVVLPLDNCGYLDYRPVAQAMHYQARRQRLYEPGPWDEPLVWLFGATPSTPVDVPPRTSCRYDVGGYYGLRGRETWGMVRCHTVLHHPHQADMLHFDLWWRGQNVLRDSGSHSYNAPEPWKHFFVSTAAHNALELAGQDQMLKSHRFSWAYPTRSQLHEFTPGVAPDCDYFQGEHYGYHRLPSRATHRRAVLRVAERLWLVVDDVLGSRAERMRLFWHLIDAPYEADARGVTLRTEQGPARLSTWTDALDARVEVIRGREKPPVQGWNSLYYGEKKPAPTWVLDVKSALPRRFVTLVSLGQEWSVKCDAGGRQVRAVDAAGHAQWTCELAGLTPGQGRVVRSWK